MKNGKIILGAAAAIVTIGSGLAFKAAYKFGIHKAFGATRKGSTKCMACRSLWTRANLLGGHSSRCKTFFNGVQTLWATKTVGVVAHTWAWRTDLTAVNRVKCGAHKVTLVTVVH